MEVQTDVIVLGLGTSGEDLALQLLYAGLDVVGVEPQLIGGECAYWACIPSKVMIRAANLLQEARRVNGVAGRADVVPDWARVATRIREEVTADWDDSMAVERFESNGGVLVRGRGKLTGPRTVTVGSQTFVAKVGVVVATGSQPLIPPIPGLADVDYWTTHDAIQVETLPGSLVILGGGAVGCELGQVFARFGVEVTIVEGQDRLLPNEESEASAVLAAVFESEGINVRVGARAQEVAATGGGVSVILEDGTTVTGDRILVALGRAVDLSGLGLESVGLDGQARSVPVDDRLRAADGLWAMGDISGQAMFTHIAVYQATLIAADILGQELPPADYTTLPRVTFSDPEVASVGMTEAQAREAGLDVAVTVKYLGATFRGWLHGPGNSGLIKLIGDKTRDVLVGATAMGPHGGEVLGLLSLAVHAEVPLAKIRSMIYAYPTFYGGIGEALGAYGRGVGRVFDPDYVVPEGLR
jgi:pyruvate/2-oxoglutarate dehydrogenase complex dihydrolipoamide dehydrogenase (E3) component